MLHFAGQADEIQRSHSLRQYSHRADVRSTSPGFSGWSRNTHPTGRPRSGACEAMAFAALALPVRRLAVLRAVISSFRNIGCV